MLVWVLCSSASLSGAACVWVRPPGMPQHHCLLLLPRPWGAQGLSAPARGKLQPLLWGQAWVMVPCL